MLSTMENPKEEIAIVANDTTTIDDIGEEESRTQSNDEEEDVHPVQEDTAIDTNDISGEEAEEDTNGKVEQEEDNPAADDTQEALVKTNDNKKEEEDVIGNEEENEEKDILKDDENHDVDTTDVNDDNIPTSTADEEKEEVTSNEEEGTKDKPKVVSLHSVANAALLLKERSTKSTKNTMDEDDSEKTKDEETKEIDSEDDEIDHDQVKTSEQDHDEDVFEKPQVSSLYQLANIALVANNVSRRSIDQDETKSEQPDQFNTNDNGMNPATTTTTTTKEEISSLSDTAHALAPDDIHNDQEEKYDNEEQGHLSSINEKEQQELYLTEKQFLQCVLLAEAASKNGHSSFKSKEKLHFLENVHIPMDKMHFLKGSSSSSSNTMANTRAMLSAKSKSVQAAVGKLITTNKFRNNQW